MTASRGMCMMQMHYFHEISRQVASNHRASEKAHSRKLVFLRPHTSTVPGRREAGRGRPAEAGDPTIVIHHRGGDRTARAAVGFVSMAAPANRLTTHRGGHY